jgi:hypothetical protein
VSFVRHHIKLPNNVPKQPAHKFKQCSHCNESRPPEGGVELSPGRWECANCWTIRMTRTKK